MSKVFQSVFGGSKKKEESKNLAYPFIKDTFGSVAQNTARGTDFISALLGLSGDGAAQSSAIQKLSDSAGMKFIMDQGSRAITGSNAARGLFRSGATGKALQDYGQNVGSTYMGSMLDRLFNLTNTGIQAGGLITDAGRYSKGKVSEKPGIAKFLGSIASGGAAG